MDISKDAINDILKKHKYNKDSLILILMEVQKISNDKYVSEEVARYIANSINIPHNKIYEVLSFFSALNNEKKGNFHIQLCDSTVCRVNKKDIIEEFIKKELNIEVGETTKDNMFTLEYTPCFGACDISPAFRINKKVYGNLTISKVKDILSDLRGDFFE